MAEIESSMESTLGEQLEGQASGFESRSEWQDGVSRETWEEFRLAVDSLGDHTGPPTPGMAREAWLESRCGELEAQFAGGGEEGMDLMHLDQLMAGLSVPEVPEGGESLALPYPVLDQHPVLKQLCRLQRLREARTACLEFEPEPERNPESSEGSDGY